MEIKSGVVISMAQQKAPAGETVDTFVSNSKLNGVDMSQSTRLTLAGQPAVHYFLWYEGFYDRYTFLKDGNEWFIVIQLPGSSKDEALKLENNYKTQINQFLQSLRFR
jgi:hypothetical protein